MGPETSETRTLLMDAVEAVMREQGYAALSARGVAARAGLKYQIVFYYFETMDELLLATYRRNAEQMRLRIAAALDSDRPLHAYWETWSDPFDGPLALEFMAMANHNPSIRAEKVAFGERMRAMLAERLTKRLQPGPAASLLTPFAVSMVLASIGGIIGFESALGISHGHSETRDLVQWCLDQLEPAPSLALQALP
jgi:AcrR family transcriptional regulator